MGHSETSTTEKYYLHFDQDMLDAAAQKLSDYRAAHGGEVLMADIARWGAGIDETQDNLERAWDTFKKIEAYDPDREYELTQAAEAQLQINMIAHIMQETMTTARQNCLKMLGGYYNEAHFVDWWNATVINQTWPAKKYVKSPRYETYLLATLRMPLDKLDHMTLKAREDWVRGAVAELRPFG